MFFNIKNIATTTHSQTVTAALDSLITPRAQQLQKQNLGTLLDKKYIN